MSKESIPFYKPLKNSVFRALWIATIVSNIGNKMHEVGGIWLMTTLSEKPLWSALIQATHPFSICVLSIFAGALADIFNKRRYLICIQLYMLCLAAALGLIVFYDKVTPLSLLLMSLCLGAGEALSKPTWQSALSQLVPSQELYTAVLLNSVTFNISRTIGPAIAGLVISYYGTWAVFILDALTFIALIIGLYKWPSTEQAPALPPEKVGEAIRAGLRYVRRSPLLHKIFLKAGVFFFFASAPWALLPVIARVVLHCTPFEYGCLYTAFGGGAILGAIILSRLRYYFNIDNLVMLSAIGYLLTILCFIHIPLYSITLVCMALCGIAWITVVSSLTALVQETVHVWVKARALSFYIMVFYGSMAVGTVTWGAIANKFGIYVSLQFAAFALVIANGVAYFAYLSSFPKIDLSLSKDSPAPQGELIPELKSGPVLVTIEYYIKKENQEKFKEIMRQIKKIREREGATIWHLFHDIENHKKFVEFFMSDSWLAHLRYHERISVSDRHIFSKAILLHEGERKPKVTHLIASEDTKK